jgi:hypothetical protein
MASDSSTAAAYLRPQPGEYAPYAGAYISLVQTNDILAALDEQSRQMLLLFSGRTDADSNFRYAPGKWMCKEVLGHINDSERILGYRALRISRGDATPLEGFEQDDYVRAGPWGKRTLADAIEDFVAVRRATLSLFRNLDEAAWTRQGVANKHNVTVRALAYFIAGHELHHRKILQERYLR